jgi:hypothetical protein
MHGQQNIKGKYCRLLCVILIRLDTLKQYFETQIRNDVLGTFTRALFYWVTDSPVHILSFTRRLEIIFWIKATTANKNNKATFVTRIYFCVSLSISWHSWTLRYLTLSECCLLFHNCYWQSARCLQCKMLTRRLSFLHGPAREILITRGLSPVNHFFLLPTPPSLARSVSALCYSLLIITHLGARYFSLHPCKSLFRTG